MAHEEDGSTAAGDFPHFAQALLLEFGIPHRQHLVDHKDLRLKVRGDRESEAHIHTGGVVFHRRVEEILNAGEVDNFIKLAADLPI